MADHSALAGSLATMDVLVHTMVKKANIPLEDAVAGFIGFKGSVDGCLSEL